MRKRYGVAGSAVALAAISALFGVANGANASDADVQCARAGAHADAYTADLSREISAGDFNFYEDVAVYFARGSYYEVVDRVPGDIDSIATYLQNIADGVAASGGILEPIPRIDIACRAMADGAVVRTSYYDLTVTVGGSSNTTRLLVTLTSKLVSNRWYFQASHRETCGTPPTITAEC